MRCWRARSNEQRRSITARATGSSSYLPEHVDVLMMLADGGELWVSADVDSCHVFISTRPGVIGYRPGADVPSGVDLVVRLSVRGGDRAEEAATPGQCPAPRVRALVAGGGQ